MAVQLRLHRVFEALGTVLKRDELDMEPVVIDLALRVSERGSLRADAQLPMQRIREAINRLVEMGQMGTP